MTKNASKVKISPAMLNALRIVAGYQDATKRKSHDESVAALLRRELIHELPSRPVGGGYLKVRVRCFELTHAGRDHLDALELES